MSFVIMLVLIWGVFMAIWTLVSRYVKSADIDKIKDRLTGGGKKKKAKAGAAGENAVVKQELAPKNKFAHMLVEKYKLGPKIAEMLEQAGMNWQPARFVHLTIVCFGAGFAACWLLLPLPHVFSPLLGRS